MDLALSEAVPSWLVAARMGGAAPDDVPARRGRRQPVVVRPVARILILIADDEPSLTKYLAALLQTQGFEVEVAGSAQRALDIAIARRKDLDLIVLDLVFKDGPLDRAVCRREGRRPAHGI